MLYNALKYFLAIYKYMHTATKIFFAIINTSKYILMHREISTNINMILYILFTFIFVPQLQCKQI